LLVNAAAKRLPILAEGIAGDTAIGNALCMAQAFEALTGISPDPGARIIRTIAFELERIANHVGDLGALSGDVAFLPPANYCGRMRGDFLNMTLWLCGNRFGKGLVRPGGVRFPLTDEDRRTLTERIEEIRPQVKHTIDPKMIMSGSWANARSKRARSSFSHMCCHMSTTAFAAACSATRSTGGTSSPDCAQPVARIGVIASNIATLVFMGLSRIG